MYILLLFHTLCNPICRIIANKIYLTICEYNFVLYIDRKHDNQKFIHNNLLKVIQDYVN